MKTVRVGPAGWSYKDWEGIVYPAHGSKFDHLAYLAGFFDTIEVNSSFYRVPPLTHSRSWVRRVGFNRDFRFTVKLYRGFTHESELLKDADTDDFRKFLDPLAESGNLGCVLVQFPWSLKDGSDTRHRLVSIFQEFADYPKAVEVRHGSFQSDEFYSFLGEHGVSLVNIDQPVFGDSVRPSDVAVGPVAYTRLHGRNYAKWFAHEESWERYDYLYSPEELEPWVHRIETMAREKESYVITNNHFRGQAIVNALDIRSALGQPFRVPEPLSNTYPDRVSRSPVAGQR